MNTVKSTTGNSSSNCRLFITCDGLAFFDETNARAHARLLSDQTITIRTPEEADHDLAGITGHTDDFEIDTDLPEDLFLS